MVVPFASVFIYACLKAYFPTNIFKPFVHYLNYFFILLLAFACLFFYQKTYTLVNCALALILLIFHQFYFKKQYMGYFWFAYFVHLIPFVIINGILTGMATPEPVVSYNANHIIGFRIITIPIEDTIYALTCLLIPITIMEFLLSKKSLTKIN